MGDDAEYYLEQMQENADFLQKVAYDIASERTKSVFCCLDNSDFYDIWSWEPLSRVEDVFSVLHKEKKLGKEYFLANENEVSATQSLNTKLINGVVFHLVEDKSQATCESIVLSQDDVTQLELEAINMERRASSLKETMLSEMLQEMVLFIRQNRLENASFLFVREL